MHAFVLLTPPSPALGDRPLIFLGRQKEGIAFALAFDPSQHKRYVYKIIVSSRATILSRAGKERFAQMAGDSSLFPRTSARTQSGTMILPARDLEVIGVDPRESVAKKLILA